MPLCDNHKFRHAHILFICLALVLNKKRNAALGQTRIGHGQAQDGLAVNLIREQKSHQKALSVLLQLCQHKCGSDKDTHSTAALISHAQGHNF